METSEEFGSPDPRGTVLILAGFLTIGGTETNLL